MSGFLRLLAISHSCVVGLNQKRYEALAKFADLDITLLFPTEYVSDFDGSRLIPDKTSDDFYRIALGRPAFPGRGSLHFYLDGLRRAASPPPHVIFLDEEPWSLSAAQALWIANRVGARLTFYTNENQRRQFPPPFCWIQRMVLRRSAWAFVAGDEAAEVLRWKGYAGPISPLPYGVDPPLLRPEDAAELRRRLGLHGTVFAYFGRLVPEKGVDVFVRGALHLCKDAGHRVMFLVVGSGPEESALRHAAQGSEFADRFIFVKKVAHSEVASCLAAVDAVVVPSLTTKRWKEQFGRVVIEALACGVPVIGSDSGEIPNLLRKTGGGLVTPEGDADALAAAMAALLADPDHRHHLAETGRRAVQDAYTNGAVASTLREVFLKVARADRR